jgi:GT2 family glycosyltransferase
MASTEPADVAAVVVTYDALPWIERCLESVAGTPTVVIDNGSTDGTVALVRERFPEARLVEAENRGLGAGWNVGIRATASRYVLILNADAWLLGDALERLVGFADSRPRLADPLSARRAQGRDRRRAPGGEGPRDHDDPRSRL